MSLLLQDTLVISPATVQRIDAEIEEIKNNTDVADVVADKAELDAYDTSRLTDNAIIKVLQDESEDDASTYYRYIKSSNTFELIGSVGPYYTKAESNNIEAQIRKDFTDADTTLQNNIDAEETRATGVENQLRTDLTAETTRATGKETELNTAITTHASNKSNPHSVTKAQVGLGNVDNTSDLNKPISTATQTALNLKLDKTEASSTYATITNLNAHTSNTSNPHSVTKAQVGLGNVDNTSDANKPISTATQTALNSKLDKVTTASQIYSTDSNGNQSTLSYSDSNVASTVVVRTAGGLINVAQTPTQNTNATSKKYVDDLSNTKVDKVTISTTTGTVALADNTIFNGNELSTLTITNPSSLTVDFSCQVNFTSGATPTTVTASNIVWVGDNVSETVGFVPRANCRYTIMFMYDGSNIRGIIQGVSL